MICLLIFAPACMTPRFRNNFKTLYSDCSKQSADKDQYIAMLEEQNKIMTEALFASSQREENYLQTIDTLQHDNAVVKQQNILHAETITALSDLNNRQEEIITDLNTTVNTQQKQIDKNKGLRTRVEELKFQLRMLKRQMYGKKSEKHHRATEDENGELLKDPQLSL